MYQKDAKQHWVIIHFQGRDSLVTIDERNPDKFYWFGGPSWCTFIDDSYIVKDYGYLWDVKDDQKLDELFLKFYKNYNIPIEEIKQSAGWISPSGKFYPCQYFEHDAYAKRLAAIYYNSMGGTKELERQGWIRLYENGNINTSFNNWIEHPITIQQINTIQDILSSETDGDLNRFEENLKDELKYILTEFGDRL
jgi:hypothetical protein